MSSENKRVEKVKDTTLVEDIVYYSILFPLILLAIILLWQKIVNPYKIPDIFGYKMFIVVDEKMDYSVEYGDLVFTHNIEPKTLKLNDLIAFRNNTNKVTLHRIIDINQYIDKIVFEMETHSNEVGDTKYVNGDQVEGIVIHRVPKIGLIVLKIQEPAVILTLIAIVVVVGTIAYYIAEKLDERDMEKQS